MNIPVNKWTIAVLLTGVAWAWLSRQSRQGDYDFGPAIFGFIVVVGTVALWGGLLLGSFL